MSWRCIIRIASALISYILQSEHYCCFLAVLVRRRTRGTACMRHVAPAGKRQISWLKKPRTAVESEERILQDVVMQDRVLQKSLRDCKQVKNRKSRDGMLQHCRLRSTLVEDVQVTIEGVVIALPIPASESMLGTGEVLLLLPGCPTTGSRRRQSTRVYIF